MSGEIEQVNITEKLFFKSEEKITKYQKQTGQSIEEKQDKVSEENRTKY